MPVAVAETEIGELCARQHVPAHCYESIRRRRRSLRLVANDTLQQATS